MKLKICILMALIIGLAVNVLADYPSINDTVRVDSVEAFAGRMAILPVYMTNEDIIAGFEVTLKFDSTYLSIDSFNFSGGRFDQIPEDDPNRVFFNDTTHMVDVSFIDFDNATPAGSGLAFQLFFSVTSSAANHDISIDTAIWDISEVFKRKTRFTSWAGTTVFPQIVPGNIRVLETPAALDSVWVDAVVGRPGNGVAVNIYGYNEAEIDSIALALEYTSDDIAYSTIDFTGTRCESALNKTVLPADQQILISIKFNSETPMPVGEGVLATLYFDIDAEAPEQTVMINSEPYGNYHTVFHRSSSGGGMTVEPFFRPGQIEIKHASPVDDEFDNALLPKEFALAQNYPNPFNPSTRIEFALPQAADVNLTVYNILGEKVKTLVDEHMNAGMHYVIFDGYDESNHPVASGMYFYRIKAGDFNRSRKMMMLK